MPPVTSSPLNQAWLRAQGRDRWIAVQATAYSCEWTSLRQWDDGVGYWHVVYEYSVGGERYIGKFADFASSSDEYLKPGDNFEIRYNPRKPWQSYYPELRTQTNYLALCALLGASLAAVVMLIAFLTGHLRR
jgi:hypothetical protein